MTRHAASLPRQARHFLLAPDISDDGESLLGSRPQTQSDSGPLSTHSTPSKHANANGRRSMAPRGDGATRRGEHLQNARAALVSWRPRTFLNKYSTYSFTDLGILPDTILTALASKRIRTLAEMADKLSVPWIFAQWHGDEVIELLKRIDQARRDENVRVAEAKQTASNGEVQSCREAQEKCHSCCQVETVANGCYSNARTHVFAFYTPLATDAPATQPICDPAICAWALVFTRHVLSAQ
ncbi:hypothetical protein K438DRAFT_1749506 [Mycena galopus ATCC 62051]|nr:hypothetical protein K438DRAFT_1749506 [Mycena galopus ATCC 62051]